MRNRVGNFAAWMVMGAAAALGPGNPAAAQLSGQLNPVYVDDSPAATETLSRVRDHLASGNYDEAVRVLQLLLDEQPDRVVAAPDGADLFISVRESVHRLVLGDARLLERYRGAQGPRAQAMLDAGDATGVERSLLLTAPGFEAALRVAQWRLESAQFEAARLALGQLEDHPDRLGPSGRDAAELLAMVARYLPRPEVRARAERWAAASRLGRQAADAPPVPWPAAATARGQNVFDPAPPVRVEGLVSKPLWSVAFAQANPMADAAVNDFGDAGLPRGARELPVVPTVIGEMVFVNDGTTVSAWDQYTLTERWRVSPTATERQAAGRRPDRTRLEYRGWGYNAPDLGTVAAAGRIVVAATGRAMGGPGEGDTLVSAIDAATGRIRWTADVTQLDPQLSDAAVRGPPVLHEGVVIVGARKAVAERRLLSLVLVGLDADTGALLWIRPLGSSGILPYMSQPGGSEATLATEGLVVRGDRLGAVGAFEAATGRPVWIRRAPVDALASRDFAASWRLGAPVQDGPWVYVLAPDQRSIMQIERATGRLAASRTTERLLTTPPEYLVLAGRRLIAVGVDQVASIPLDDFAQGPAATGPRLPSPGIHGRVSVAGDRLVLPVPAGVLLVNPEAPAEPGKLLRLDEPGAVLALDSQLIVADDTRLHSYLMWEVAEALLSSRMRADPADPAPAVTFAELAYRAERPQRILEGVDAALRAIAAKPESDGASRARRRLFDALRDMTTNSLEQRQAQPSDASRAARTGPRIADAALVAALVDRMEQCAATPDDRVAHLLAAGRVRERAGRPAEAAATYQRVLDDPRLAVATWRGAQVAVRGDIEATRRIEQLIETVGPSVYAEQDARAAVELGALGAQPGIRPLHDLAARYPLAASTPGAHLLMAREFERLGQDAARLQALESGYKSALRIARADPAVVGQLAGSLIDALMARGQYAAAASVLRSFPSRFPAARLASGDRALDAQAIGAELDRRIAQTVRWPRVGPPVAQGVQAVPQATLLDRLIADDAPAASSCVAMIGADEVSVWSIRGAQAGALLGRVWARPLGRARAYMLNATHDAAFLMILGDDNGELLRVAAAPGERQWTASGLYKNFDVPPQRSIRAGAPPREAQFPTPLDGIVSQYDLTVAMDERTIALVQRGGRAAVFDSDTGEMLWAGPTPVARVYRTAIASGVLIVAGEEDIAAPGGGVVESRPVVQTIDARNGRQLQRMTDLGGRPHWVRPAPDGSLIVGVDRAVLSLDMASGRVNWTITAPEVVPAMQAWVFGDRLIFVGPDRTLWQASVLNGRLRAQPLDAPRTHVEGASLLGAFPASAAPDADAVVVSPQGMLVYAPDGTLRGVDALGGFEALMTPRAAEGRAVTIETIADGRTADGLMLFQVHQFDTRSAALLSTRSVVLGAHPTAMAVLDGRIVISAGEHTVVIPAPAGE